MNPKSEYERLKSKSLLDVCLERAQLDGAISSSRLAQLVYEEKQMEPHIQGRSATKAEATSSGVL